MPKPLIMITGQTDAADGVLGVKERWANWLVYGGATAMIAPPIMDGESIDQLLSMVDGVLVPGGVDVDPALYGCEQYDPTRPLAPVRDAFESAVIRRVVELDMPLLCVCRGIQLLNVVFGGTLNQHVADRPNAAVHWQEPPYDMPVHTVGIVDDTLLSQVIGAGTLQVNSLHIQGISKKAPRLTVAAIAEDGLVEALELPEARFCLGVQWHPEYAPKAPASQKLLAAFLEAAQQTARYRKARA